MELEFLRRRRRRRIGDRLIARSLIAVIVSDGLTPSSRDHRAVADVEAG